MLVQWSAESITVEEQIWRDIGIMMNGSDVKDRLHHGLYLEVRHCVLQKRCHCSWGENISNSPFVIFTLAQELANMLLM